MDPSLQTTSDLLTAEITYDIIVSDFGRDAALEYLRLAAAAEKRTIVAALGPSGHAFFDEYRRIMFTAVGDIAFFKEKAIRDSVSQHGYLTEDILVGDGLSPFTTEFVDRVAVTVAQEALAAIDRGHRHLRVAIPCNGLSNLATAIGRLISSEEELVRLAQAFDLSTSSLVRVGAAPIPIRTVPEAVVRQLADQRPGSHQNLLVLGTRGANAIYGALTDSDSIRVLPLDDSEFELITRAIVSSIGGTRADVAQCREQLDHTIIRARRDDLENLVVLEACTDFHFGLGLSSLQLFAEAMVEECYRPRHGLFPNSTPSRSIQT